MCGKTLPRAKRLQHMLIPHVGLEETTQFTLSPFFQTTSGEHEDSEVEGDPGNPEEARESAQVTMSDAVGLDVETSLGRIQEIFGDSEEVEAGDVRNIFALHIVPSMRSVDEEIAGLGPSSFQMASLPGDMGATSSNIAWGQVRIESQGALPAAERPSTTTQR